MLCVWYYSREMIITSIRSKCREIYIPHFWYRNYLFIHLSYYHVYFTLLGISPLPHDVFCFSLKGPRAHIFFAEDDSSQSRNVPNMS